MTYTKDWFAGQVSTSEASAGVVAPMVFEMVRPKSVVDVGCGLGAWAAAFAKLGAEVLGVDGDYVDRSMLRIAADKFRAHDLTKPLDLGRTFDLAVCLEVAEHLPESVASQFVEGLTRAAPAVLFSAAVPGQGGNNHLNEQWQSYWSEKFKVKGYETADAIRQRVWDDNRVEWWYRQNMLVFFSAPLLAQRPDLRALVEETRGRPRDVVHPRLLDQHLETMAHPVRALVRKQSIRLRKGAKKMLGK